MPMALAVFLLTESSKRAACSIAMSPGLAPFSTRASRSAAWRKSVTKLFPYDINPPSSTDSKSEYTTGTRRSIEKRATSSAAQRIPNTEKGRQDQDCVGPGVDRSAERPYPVSSRLRAEQLQVEALRHFLRLPHRNLEGGVEYSCGHGGAPCRWQQLAQQLDAFLGELEEPVGDTRHVPARSRVRLHHPGKHRIRYPGEDDRDGVDCGMEAPGKDRRAHEERVGPRLHKLAHIRPRTAGVLDLEAKIVPFDEAVRGQPLPYRGDIRRSRHAGHWQEHADPIRASRLLSEGARPRQQARGRGAKQERAPLHSIT